MNIVYTVASFRIKIQKSGNDKQHEKFYQCIIVWSIRRVQNGKEIAPKNNDIQIFLGPIVVLPVWRRKVSYYLY